MNNCKTGIKEVFGWNRNNYNLYCIAVSQFLHEIVQLSPLRVFVYSGFVSVLCYLFNYKLFLFIYISMFRLIKVLYSYIYDIYFSVVNNLV